jgi:hypothetical protein
MHNAMAGSVMMTRYSPSWTYRIGKSAIGGDVDLKNRKKKHSFAHTPRTNLNQRVDLYEMRAWLRPICFVT